MGFRTVRGAAAAFVVAIAVDLVLSRPAVADFKEAQQLLDKGEFAAALAPLELSAAAGDVRAMDALGAMYLKGLGVAKSVPTAMSWYCNIANHPDGGPVVAHGAWFLAEYFRTGGGLPGREYNDGQPELENPLRAYFWFGVLAAQESFYEAVYDRGVTLGRIGLKSVGRDLYDEEKASIEAVLKVWAPQGSSFKPRDDCLSLPILSAPPK